MWVLRRLFIAREGLMVVVATRSTTGHEDEQPAQECANDAAWSSRDDQADCGRWTTCGGCRRRIWGLRANSPQVAVAVAVGRAYLAEVINRIVAGHPQSQIDELLPHAYAARPLEHCSIRLHHTLLR